MLTVRLKPVADPEDRFNILLAIAAQLFSQSADMHIQGAGANLCAVTPDSPQQSLAGNDLTGVLHQQRQELELLARQNNPSLIEQGRRACEIHFQMRILIPFGPRNRALK